MVVPTEATAPPGFAPPVSKGKAPAPLQIALKAGPLPPITALAFRPGGSASGFRLLAVGTYAALVVWNLSAGHPALIVGDVPGQVHALAWSPDGRHLAVGSGLPARSGSVRVYAVPQGTIEYDLTGHDDVVTGLAFSPDGSQLASSSFDQTVRLWKVNTSATGDAGRSQVFHGHSDAVNDVAFSRDGKSLLSVGKDRAIKRIDLATFKELRTYSEHNDEVLALAVQPDGARFVTAGAEPQVRWWGFDGEKSTMKVGGHAGPVHQLNFSRDGRRLISAGGDPAVRLWDGSTGILIKTFPLPESADWQFTAALSDDGRLAAAGGWDGQVRLWDVESSTLRATLLQTPGDGRDSTDWLIVVPTGFFAPPTRFGPWSAGARTMPRCLPTRREPCSTRRATSPVPSRESRPIARSRIDQNHETMHASSRDELLCRLGFILGAGAPHGPNVVSDVDPSVAVCRWPRIGHGAPSHRRRRSLRRLARPVRRAGALG